MQKRRLVSIILGLAMLFTVLPTVPVFAATTSDSKTAKGWTIMTNNVDGHGVIDETTAYDGKYSLKIVNNTGFGAYKYMQVTTNIPVEKDKTYRYSIAIKADKAAWVRTYIGSSALTSLIPFGTPSDWREYEFDYTHTSASVKTVKLGIQFDDATTGVWLDKITCYECENGVPVGENLVSNSSFEIEEETKDNTPPPEVTSGETSDLEEVYNTIKSAQVFKASDMNKVLASTQFAPVYPAKDLKMDGDLSDWDENKYPIINLPTLPTQYTFYLHPDKALDLRATLQYAYDDTYFYFALDVEDDKHVYLDSESCWWSDSVQLAIGTESEDYGTEFNMVYVEELKEVHVYSTSLSSSDMQDFILTGSRKNGHTYYEVAIPWSVKFGGGLDHSMTQIPEKFPFNILINEDDGDGRWYALELDGEGISTTKKNNKHPKLRPMKEGQEWYAWLEGEKVPKVGTTEIYDLTLVNNSEKDKTFTVKNQSTGDIQTYNIPADQGRHQSIQVDFATDAGMGNQELIFEISDGVVTDTVTHYISLQPTTESAQNSVAELKKKLKKLETLLKRCKKQGISTDYEDARYTIIERFLPGMEDDIKKDDLQRIIYTENCLNKLYDEATQNCKAYLAGTKEPLDAPTYVLGDIDIDGVSMIGDMEYADGTIVRQPVFMIGSGHNVSQGRGQLQLWPSLGWNTMHMEIGPSMWMSTTPGWEVTVNKSPDYLVQLTDESGVSGRGMHVVYNSDGTEKQSVTVSQQVQVEPGATYQYKMKIKGTVGRAYFYADKKNTAVENKVYSDWTEISGNYTAGTSTSSATFTIFVDGTSDFYLDDMSFQKEGDSEQKELFKNADFETGAGEVATSDFDSVKLGYRKEVLELAEENNVATVMVISPHYMLDSLLNDYKNDGLPAENQLFLHFDINHPVARELVEKHIRDVIPVLKNYSSIKSIVLTNEPMLEVRYMKERYQTRWEEYLRDVYNNDITQLNRTYETDYTSFEEVPIPDRDTRDSKFYDYNEFINEVFTEWHAWMAGIVRELWPEIPIQTKQMNEFFTSDATDRRRLLDGTDPIRFAEFTDINGLDNGLCLTEVTSGGRGALEETMAYDLFRGVEEAPVANTEDHIVQDRSQDFSDEQQYHFGWNIWQGALHGRAWSNVWIWQRGTDQSDKAWGSILYRPDCTFQVSKSAMDLNRLAYEVTAIQNKTAKVAVMYSQASRIHSIAYMNAVYQTYAANMYNGVRMNFVFDHENQIGKIHDADVLIIPAAYQVTDSTVKEVAEFIRQGGKVITIGDEDKILAYDVRDFARTDAEVDYIHEHSQNIPATMFQNDMTSPTQDELRQILGQFYKEEGLMNVTIVDADTGETVNGIEWQSAVYDGRTVINISNNVWEEPRTISVYVNGEKVTDALELRDNVQLGESWTVEPFQPILIQTALLEKEPGSIRGEADGTRQILPDTLNHWARNYITELYSKGVLGGYEDGNFYPENNITRAEFAKMIAGALGIEADDSDENIFADVPADEWYRPWVNAMNQAGLIQGYDGTFCPNDLISREDMAAIICRGLAYKGITLSGEDGFVDSAEIADYAAEAVGALAESGILTGSDGKFLPKNNTTRAEAATVVFRMLETLD